MYSTYMLSTPLFLEYLYYQSHMKQLSKTNFALKGSKQVLAYYLHRKTYLQMSGKIIVRNYSACQFIPPKVMAHSETVFVILHIRSIIFYAEFI